MIEQKYWFTLRELEFIMRNVRNAVRAYDKGETYLHGEFMKHLNEVLDSKGITHDYDGLTNKEGKIRDE